MVNYIREIRDYSWISYDFFCVKSGTWFERIGNEQTVQRADAQDLQGVLRGAVHIKHGALLYARELRVCASQSDHRVHEESGAATRGGEETHKVVFEREHRGDLAQEVRGSAHTKTFGHVLQRV